MAHNHISIDMATLWLNWPSGNKSVKINIFFFLNCDAWCRTHDTWHVTGVMWHLIGALHPSKSWKRGFYFSAVFPPYFYLSFAEYKIFIMAPSEAKSMPKYAFWSWLNMINLQKNNIFNFLQKFQYVTSFIVSLLTASWFPSPPPTPWTHISICSGR